MHVAQQTSLGCRQKAKRKPGRLRLQTIRGSQGQNKWPPGKWCHGRRRSHVRKVFRLCICGGPDPFRSKELIWVAPPPCHFHSSRHVTHFSPALLHFAFPDRHHHHPGSHGTASPCCCISSQEPHVRVCACVCVQEHTRIHACTPTCRLTVHFLRH